MSGYILKRLIFSVPTIIGVTLIVFFIMRIAPGDVVDVIVGDGAVSEERRQQLREDLGLDKPIILQYFSWMRDIVLLDGGNSLITDRPIMPEIGKRFLVTAELAFGAILVSLIIAIPAGVLSAIRQNSLLDYAMRVLSVGGLSLPTFWIAILVLLFLGKYVGWLPPIRYHDPIESPIENFKQMIIPILILGYALAAIVARMTRSSMLEVLRDDYTRTAWAKGLRERVVVTRHVPRNALLPVITITGSQLGYVLGGTVITESIFVIPGLGLYTLDGILNRDYPVVQLTVVVLAIIHIITNLLTDICYGIFDPRIRLHG